jgi:RNA polymerase sigma-70 factor (ECF subfamily)
LGSGPRHAKYFHSFAGKYYREGVNLVNPGTRFMQAVDQVALSQLLDEQGAALVLYAQQWCGAPEDVVQEAFIRLMRQRPAPANAVGWLYRVVRNGAISASRAQSRRVRHESAAGSTRPAWFKPADEESPEVAAAVAALESLPVDQREVIVLRLWSGLSFEEMAVLIGKSTSTAHRRYETALSALREIWSELCQNQAKCR